MLTVPGAAGVFRFPLELNASVPFASDRLRAGLAAGQILAGNETL